MKIVSYNVNGIRAALKKGLLEWLETESPDVVCLQELKATADQFDESVFSDLGYHNYWNSAEKKGYSGVAILSKKKPLKITSGIEVKKYDCEGRVIKADFDTCSVISLYLPSGSNLARLQYKLDFMEEFREYIQKCLKETPNIIICGDYNICHQAIDIHDPVRNKNVSGFLPVEREWFTKYLELGLVDSFRMLNPEPDQYSWWSYRANSRVNNKGWRLDYVIVSETLAKSIDKSFIRNQVFQSDHCPVGIELKL